MYLYFDYSNVLGYVYSLCVINDDKHFDLMVVGLNNQAQPVLDQSQCVQKTSKMCLIEHNY